jgi:hypothetical protein
MDERRASRPAERERTRNGKNQGRGSAHAGPVGQPDRLGDRSGLHLLHDPGAVDLDRLLADAER